MKEPVIVQKNVKDQIRLENQYDFNTILTIGLVEFGDFYLTIEFSELTMEDFKTLAKLNKSARRISIKSNIIDREGYNITHIVIKSFTADNNFSVTWECFSDDPALYDNLEVK